VELNTDFDFPYGESFLTAHVPSDNISFILKKREIKGIDNEREAIAESLKSPTGCRPLVEQVQKNDRVAVIVTDNTRACPDDRLLPPILSELEKKVSRDNITIIIALGLHPPLDREALVKKLGSDIVENYRVINHDVNDTL